MASNDVTPQMPTKKKVEKPNTATTKQIKSINILIRSKKKTFWFDSRSIEHDAEIIDHNDRSLSMENCPICVYVVYDWHSVCAATKRSNRWHRAHVERWNPKRKTPNRNVERVGDSKWDIMFDRWILLIIKWISSKIVRLQSELNELIVTIFCQKSLGTNKADFLYYTHRNTNTSRIMDLDIPRRFNAPIWKIDYFAH